MAQTLTEEDINAVVAKLSPLLLTVERNLQEKLQVVESNLNSRFASVENSIRSLNRKVHDLESDNRTTMAVARAVREMGVGFKEIPYQLEGNAAIENIKEYY